MLKNHTSPTGVGKALPIHVSMLPLSQFFQDNAGVNNPFLFPQRKISHSSDSFTIELTRCCRQGESKLDKQIGWFRPQAGEHN